MKRAVLLERRAVHPSDRGLTSAEADERLGRFGRNDILDVSARRAPPAAPARAPGTVDRAADVGAGRRRLDPVPALAVVRYRQGHGLADACVSAVTLAVAALPEVFPVVFTFFLGVGVYRLARRQALVRRATSVENMAA